MGSPDTLSRCRLPAPLLSACAGCTLIVSAMRAGLPSVLVVALAIMSAGFLGMQFIDARGQDTLRRWGLIFGYGCAVAVIGCLLRVNDHLDGAYAVLASWLVAAMIFFASYGFAQGPPRIHWQRLALAWILIAAGFCLVDSHLKNFRGAFHLGAVSLVAALVIGKRLFRLPVWEIQAVNVLLLLLVGLPLLDLYVRAKDASDDYRDPARRYFAYENAIKHPAKYRAWWTYSWAEYGKLTRQIFVRQNSGDLPFRPKPSSSGMLLQSRISINSRGFRGPEILEPKGSAYRIVVLGESTSFGITLTATSKPWPEFLEALIREQLKPDRPVQVINAGVPTYDLRQNLGRLLPEILPLNPDLIISYHGYNGFRFIDSAIPVLSVRAPNVFYKPRPLKLLADVEHNLKVRFYRAKNIVEPPASLPPLDDPMASEYATAYRELIQFAQSNHIRLVLGTYSMAVNPASDQAVIDFYHWTFPMVTREMRANVAHTVIVKQLARENPEISLVDTQPAFDGRHELFIDIAHFTEEGEHKMAETFFAGLKTVLEHDLKVK